MSTIIILDGKRVDGTIFGHNPEPDHSTDDVPEPSQPSSSKNIVVPEASQKSNESEDVTMMPKRHRLFDAAFEQTLGQVGQFTCPYEECHFSNYVFGFRTKGARNRHMLECSYGKGTLQKNVVATDGQMPSARFIENLVDRYTKRVDLNRALQQLFKKPDGVENVSSLNISAPPPAAQESVNKNSQTAEQSRPQLPNATLENNNNNNNVILSSYGGSGQVGGQEMLTERYVTQGGTSGNNVTSSSFRGSGQLQENYPNKSGGLENNEMMISFAQPGLLPEQNLTVGGSVQNNAVLNPNGMSGHISENNPIQNGVLDNNNLMVNPVEELGQFPTLVNNMILSSSGEPRTFPGNYQPQSGAFANAGTINSYGNSGLLPEYQFPIESGLNENNAISSSYKGIKNFPGNYPLQSGAFENTGMMNSGFFPKYNFPAEMAMLDNNAILSSYGTSGQFPQQYPTNSNTLGNNVNLNSYGELPQLPQQYVPQSGTLENNRIMNSFGEPGQLTEYYAAESGLFNSNGMVCSYDELREILDEPHPTENAIGVSNGGQIPHQYPTQGGSVAHNEIGSSYGEFGQLIENQNSAVETNTLGSLNESFYNAGDYNSHRPLEGTSNQEGFRFSEIDKMFDNDFHAYLRGTTEYENVSMEDVLISNPSRMLDDPFAWNG